MAKWFVSFIVDGGKFANMMEILIPMKVDQLEFKIVAGTPTRIRAGDKPAWQAVMEVASHAHKKTSGKICEDLAALGYSKQAVYSGIDQAVRKGVLVRSGKTGSFQYYIKGQGK